MNFPEGLIYTGEHQWLMIEEDPSLIRIGVTDFFQSRMEEIIYVERPPRGEVVKEGEPIFLIESGKTVYEFTSPLSGKLDDVNKSVLDTPGLLNSDPYGEGWLVVLRAEDFRPDPFFSSREYAEYVKSYHFPLPPFT